MVKLVQNSAGSMKGNTETERSSSISAKIKYFLGLEDDVNELTGYTDIQPAGDPATWDPPELMSAESNSKFTGSGETARSESLKATVSALVTDVLRNGNLVIYGNQVVTVSNEASVLTVQGIVRPSDISDDNTVDSSRVANAVITLKPSGVVADNQHPGWAMRAFAWVWPF
jgi:flagellar L-ring protein precursor FlgH